MFGEKKYITISELDNPFLVKKDSEYQLTLTLEQIADLLFILDCYRRETLDCYKASSKENKRRVINLYDSLISKSSDLIRFFENSLDSSHIKILFNEKENLKRKEEWLGWRHADDFQRDGLQQLYNWKIKKEESEN